jgi:RNA polymerase sigma-70 factor (ECF subfamily)
MIEISKSKQNDNLDHLVTSLKNNDEKAFEIIYKQFYSRLFFFALEFIPFQDLVENIVQDTFLSLWNKRKELKNNTNLNAYLFTITKNNCLYRLRDKKYSQKIIKTKSSISDLEIQLNIKTLEAADTNNLVFSELEELIERTINSLPPRCKEVFVLSRYKDLKNREIAEQLEISEKVVEKHISKALKTLRINLKDYLPLVLYLFK